MPNTMLTVLPGPWDDTVIRNDTFERTFEVPGNYTSPATWLVRARIGKAAPLFTITEATMTISYNATLNQYGVTGWTFVTFLLTDVQTLALATTNDARWAIRSTLAGKRKTWFAGSLIIAESAIEEPLP